MTSLKKAREYAHSLGYGIVKSKSTSFPWDVVLPNGHKWESRSIGMCTEIIKNHWRRKNKPACNQNIHDATVKSIIDKINKRKRGE